MTREEHYEKIKTLFDSTGKVILKLPTSFGKTKCAIDLIKSVVDTKATLFEQDNVLIVVPKLVLIDNWKDELKKWDFPESVNVVFTTYVSYPKHVGTPWSVVIFDETHHFTENCFECTCDTLKTKYVIAMSATIPKEPRWRLKDAFPGIKEYAVTARTAIEENILPDPKILFIPCMLDNKFINEVIVKQKSKSGEPVVLMYQKRREAFSIKNRPIHIKCTQQEWYNYHSELIEWWKQQFIASRQVYQKNQWLRLAKTRLDWLAEKKSSFVKELLKMVAPFRVLTFCTSIEQTENLGKYCINSKNKNSLEYLEDFNEGRINHITACGMLNEGRQTCPYLSNSVSVK